MKIAAPAESALTWRVRASFVQYVAALPDGEIVSSEGATEARPAESRLPGPWVFSGDGWTETQDAITTLKFRGRLSFSGHGGMMSATVLDPWITVTGAHAELSIAGGSPASNPAARTTIARTSDDAIIPTFSDPGTYPLPLELTDAGSEFFNHIYPAGTLMNDAHVRLGTMA